MATTVKSTGRMTQNNLVAKYARKFNKSHVMRDRKRDAKRGHEKHKGKHRGGDQ